MVHTSLFSTMMTEQLQKKKTKTKKTWAFTHLTKDSSKYIIECKMKNYETLTKKEKFSLSRAK